MREEPVHVKDMSVLQLDLGLKKDEAFEKMDVWPSFLCMYMQEHRDFPCILFCFLNYHLWVLILWSVGQI